MNSLCPDLLSLVLLNALPHVHFVSKQWARLVVSDTTNRSRLTTLPLFKWAHDNGCRWTAVHAAAIGSIDIAHVHCTLLYVDHACSSAARAGHLNVVQWCVVHGATIDKWAGIYAAAGGHVNVLEWVFQNNLPLDTPSINIDAATNGHINVLKWSLHKGFPLHVVILQTAAWNGHLHIVEWCTEHGIPINQATLAYARDHDHVHILDWCACRNWIIDEDLHYDRTLDEIEYLS